MKKIILSTLVASLLVTGVNAKETAAKDASVQEVNKIVLSNAKKDANAQKAKLTQEAIDSLKETHDALVALEKKDAVLATKKLESALGKLEVILAAKDAPALLPIDSMVTANEFVGNSEDIHKTLTLIETLIAKGKVQEARTLMLPLQSEIDITVVSLPLATYPDALKLAAKYVHDNKLDKAHDVLVTALSTFTKVTEIVSIPLLKATDLIEASSVIAKDDKKRALAYLDAANESLKVAHDLGYVSKSTTTYKMMEDQIEAVKKEINGPNKAEKLFETLKASLKEFKEKVFSEKSSNEKK
ncbi:MAG TPA: YfdX family protein [Epsilonproteobacteria bacterium]|nr:YfdX family protein [Campylobacterota bacterium]